MLFGYRGRAVGSSILNHTLIPMLCRKAGVPTTDARGPITSHRARSTIATQLYNAKEPMSLVALKEWLGHRCLASTQWYATVSPDKLTQAYVDARYFQRNVAVVQVLLDRDAIESGAAGKGEIEQIPVTETERKALEGDQAALRLLIETDPASEAEPSRSVPRPGFLLEISPGCTAGRNLQVEENA